MLKQLEGARLGLFIFIGTVLIVISIFTIGNKESLFVSSITIKSKFTNIEGLRSGAPVRLSGYTIGSVSSIVLSGDSAGTVIVTMRIDQELRHFIRIDSEASIQTEGLVGKKIISITPGSQHQPVADEGSYIKSKTPMNITKIMEDSEAIISYMKDITKDFSEIVHNVNTGSGSVSKLINDDRLYETTVGMIQTANKDLNQVSKTLEYIADLAYETIQSAKNTFTEIDTVIFSIKNISAKVEKGEGFLGEMINDTLTYDSIKVMINNLVSSTEAAHQGLSSFAENMEALKHNWLFKSYFEERGYWDQLEYQKAIDEQINELKKQNDLLESKIKELKDLGVDINELRN
ncbi:MAG: MCE family protein [Chlorobi bacterium]|nr:MCE family protein [Chlorobiota bacterium]